MVAPTHLVRGLMMLEALIPKIKSHVEISHDHHLDVETDHDHHLEVESGHDHYPEVEIDLDHHPETDKDENTSQDLSPDLVLQDKETVKES